MRALATTTVTPRNLILLKIHIVDELPYDWTVRGAFQVNRENFNLFAKVVVKVPNV